MGLFDKAFSLFGSGETQETDPKARLIQAALGMLSNNGQSGGLSGLVSRFQQAGLGEVIGSWISTGQNLPVSPDQIQQVLGDGHLQQISEEAGLPQEETARHLSGVLPEMVDKLTPNGQVPQGGLGDIGSLLGRLRR